MRNAAKHVDPRSPTQLVLQRPEGGPPLLADQVASGVIRPGDVVVHLTSGTTARPVRMHSPAAATPRLRNTSAGSPAPA